MARGVPKVPFEDRFWARVDKTQPCWEWKGARDRAGYGVVRFEGKPIRTHRIAWALAKGPVPDGKQICHTCDNPPCCNPFHLFPGSYLENARDAQEKGRRPTTSAAGRSGVPGSIYPYKDGWRVYVSGGSDPVSGKRRQITKVVKGTLADAERVRSDLLAKHHVHAVDTNDVTFLELLERFVSHKALSGSGTTADTYRHQLAYIPVRLGATPISKITPAALDGFYGHLATKGNKRTGRGLSPAAVRNVHVVIRGAFELARRYGWVAVNPAANAEPPKLAHRLPSPAPAEAVDALFRAAAEEHQALPLYLRVTLCAGGRRAEIHGLRWSTVDFAAGRITLRETVVRSGKEWVVKPTTKTGGERFVDIDPGTLDLLRGLHDQAFERALAYGLTLPSGAFVFSDEPLGMTPWKPATTARRFKRACEAAGLPATTRLHDLRHLMATHLIDQGVSIAAVSARLGHAQNSTTLDIYTGRVAASDRSAADVMGRLLDGTTPPVE